MRTTTRTLVLAAFLLGLTAGSGSALAQCNWEFLALADVFGWQERVTSSHFGRITRVDCINSRSMAIRSETHLNGSRLRRRTIVGGPARLGASLFDEARWFACAGAWDSSTRAGTRYLFIYSWYGFGVSGIYFPNCLPEQPPPCSIDYENTGTWSFSGKAPPKLAEHQLKAGLSRSEERAEGNFLMDEWALLNVKDDASTVTFASTAGFQERIEESAGLYRLGAPGGDGATLIVEAPHHAENSRKIPVPSLRPLAIELGDAARREAGESWFRAEIAASGEVDRMTILQSSGSLSSRALRAAVAENLSLEFADDRRHRAVVFGLAKVDDQGLLTLNEGLVILPQCCCWEFGEFC